MRKWLMLVLLGMFVSTAIVGCGKKDKEADTEKDAEPAATK
ncbi:MAG: hypothetical protein Q8Q12_13865 [bacterium]|nr:hypothetical protein [bacterium]